MPNHVTVQIRALPKVQASLLADALDGTKVDFEKLIPFPDGILLDGCTHSHPEGEVCWREWSIENWGTKWNAYDYARIDEFTIEFQTAWDYPEPVIEALIAKHPNETIEVKYADENFGYNLGHFIVDKGNVTDLVYGMEIGSDEAVEWACQLTRGMSYAEWSSD